VVFLYEPSDEILFSATGSRSFRAPTFDEMFISSASIANSNLSLEKAWTSDAGVNWKPGRFDLKLTGFITHVSDVIDTDPTTLKLENGGTERRKGIEFSARTEVGRNTSYRHLALSAEIAGVSSRRQTPATFNQDLPARMTPRREVLVRIDQILPYKCTLTHEIRYKSERFESDGYQGTRLPPYTVWNMRFKTKFWAADLFADMENVLGVRETDALGGDLSTVGGTGTALAPRPARTFWAGISIRFIN
jgi:outer membrane receptor protein involved in Fe transport